MPTFKARAIILRSHKLGEADKIIRMYSREGRIISAVAKGSRKTRSRFRGRLSFLIWPIWSLQREETLI